MFKLFEFGIGFVFIINFALATVNANCSENSQCCNIYRYKCGATGAQGICGPTGPTGATGALTTNSASFFRADSTQQPVSIEPTFVLFDTVRHSSIRIAPSNSASTMVTTYDTFTVQSNGLYQITWSFNSIPNVTMGSGDTLLIANLYKTGVPIPPNPNTQQSCIIGAGGSPIAINSFLCGSVTLYLESSDYIQLQVSGAGNPNIDPFANISQATITITQIGL